MLSLNKVRRAIAVCEPTIKEYGLPLSGAEIRTMKRVMRETDCNGGPWFEMYAKERGLFNNH